jgi:hypothetical protein
MKREMEDRFGHDFSQVELHTDALAQQSARAWKPMLLPYGRTFTLELGNGSHQPQPAAGSSPMS